MNFVFEFQKTVDCGFEFLEPCFSFKFDQRQREMGKPTSKELDQRAKLEKFMKAVTSSIYFYTLQMQTFVFKHPEMDFSNAKFSGGGFGGGMGGFPNNV